MIKYDYEHVIYCDIDDTIIKWGYDYNQPFDGSIKITCPHTGEDTHHRPHKRHIRFIKKQIAKGVGIVFWSASGVAWAEAVIKAVGLDEYDVLVASKPSKCIDDLKNANEILTCIFYLDDNGYSY